MSQQKPASPFGCCFCRVALEPLPFRVTDTLWTLALMRAYSCPHCFQCYFRPFSVLLSIPVIGSILASILDRLGLLPALKTKQAEQMKPASLVVNEVACTK